MPRLTITIPEEQAELLDELSGGGGPYESKSEAVREFIRGGERVSDLEREVERLNRERRQLLEQREEHAELVRYVEHERSLQERQEERERRREARQNAPVWRRAWKWVFGHADDTDGTRRN